MNTIDLFKQLVSIDSITGEEKEVAKFVFNFLKKECNLKPIIDKDNNVFVKVEGKGEAIFFNAHLDTVQPGKGIVPVVKNGIIKSEGETILGADNKASVSAILSALNKLLDSKKEHRPLEILFTVSEESGNIGAINFDKSKIKSKIGFIFDLNRPIGTIVKAAPFYARFSIEIIGRSAHASRRDLAIPVIEPLLKIISEIEKLRTDNLLVNIGQVYGGSARNTIIGTIKIEGELRSFHKNIFNEAIDSFSKLMLSSNKNKQIKIHHEVIVENPGYLHSVDDINLIKNLIEKILKKKTNVIETLGCSDGNIFNSHPTLKTFDLGDGGKGAHTTDESISVKNLLLLKKLISELMSNLY